MNIFIKIGIFSIQLLILTVIYISGNLIANYFHLKVPGNVIGIIILLCLLSLRVIKIDHIQLAANGLLKHLGFFFIPISVGLMTLGSVILHEGLSILIVLSISAVIGLVSAGKATQSLINRKDEVKVNSHDHSI